jgi:Ni,Fe-hydrogenase maturation factor
MKNQRKNDKSETENRLRNWLSNSRRVVIAGIGNPLRKDDFVGVKIVRNLRNKVSEAVYLIECETVPESFIKPIENFKPTHILIIDAALLNLKPGSPKLIEPNRNINPRSTSSNILRVSCKNNRRRNRSARDSA